MSQKIHEVTKPVGERGKRSSKAMKTKPFPHQTEALKRMQGSKNFAVFAEQGTGKSKIAIDRAAQLHREKKIDCVLVVSPKEVHRQWAHEQLPEHCPVLYRAYDWKWRGAIKFDPKVLTFVCTYFDIVRTNKHLDMLQELLANKRFLLIVDEGHRCKDRKTLTWKAMQVLSRTESCVARLLLTGTPIAKKLVDEWNQFFILDPTIINIYSEAAFEAEYAIDKNDDGSVTVQNLERFQKLTRGASYRILKSQMKGMPPKMHVTRRFNMTTEQSDFYREMLLNLMVEVENGSIASASSMLAVLQRVQQISNGFVVLDHEKGSTASDNIKPLFESVHENPRIKALKELVASLKNDEPVIVWCRYIADCAFVMEALGKENCALYNGTVQGNLREEALNSFLSNEKRFFIATPGSGGTGLNLQTGGCTTAVYYSNSENSVQRWQSEDRIHRIGSKGTCVYYDLIAKQSRDEEILFNLLRKKVLSSLTLDDLKLSVSKLLAQFAENEGDE